MPKKSWTLFEIIETQKQNYLFEKKNEVKLPFELVFEEDFFEGVSTW